MRPEDARPWYVPFDVQQAQYMNLINNAVLPHEAKDFLRYLASKCSWNHTKGKNSSYKPMYATIDTMSIHMDRSPDYIAKAKRLCLELGWIQVVERPSTSLLIYPVIGSDDPTRERKKPRENWLRQDLEPVAWVTNS